MWLQGILEDIGEKQEGGTVLFCNNKAVVSIGKNPVNHDHTKDNGMKYHFIREAIENGEIQLTHCRTEQPPQDQRKDFFYLRELIEVVKKVHFP